MRGSVTSARDRDAHLHAAGQLARIGAREARQADHGERRVDLRRSCAPARALEPQRQIHVAPGGGPRHQGRLLEHEADVAARAQHVLAAGPPDDPSGARRAEPGDQAQRRALAAARRPEQAQELVLADAEVEALQRDDAIRERLADALEPDQLAPGRRPHRPRVVRSRDRHLRRPPLVRARPRTWFHARTTIPPEGQ
jgi:hypothetical protein